MVEKKKIAPNFRIVINKDMGVKGYVTYKYEGRWYKKYTGINQHRTYDKRFFAAQLLVRDLTDSFFKPDKKNSGFWSAARAWIDTRKLEVKLKTYYEFTSKLNRFQDFVGDSMVNEHIILAYFEYRKKELHPTTYNTTARILKQIFKGAGYPFPVINKLKAVETPARYFQSHQVELLRRHMNLHDPELLLFCGFICYTFLRPGREARLLQVCDIDFDDWTVRVKAENSKSGKERYINIPKSFRPLVSTLKMRAPTSYVFTCGRYKHGRPVGINNMPNRHHKVLQALGFSLKEYKLYSWKHTGAISAIRNKVPHKELQVCLGHASLDMTDRYLRQIGWRDTDTFVDCMPTLL